MFNNTSHTFFCQIRAPVPSLPACVQDRDAKKQAAREASLRRLCCPKKGSGKLEVAPETYRQWKQGGAQRKALLNLFIKCGDDKDCVVSLGLVWF